MLEAMYDLCVHFGKHAFIVLSLLYLYFGFSNKHFSIQFQFNSIHRYFDDKVASVRAAVQRPHMPNRRRSRGPHPCSGVGTGGSGGSMNRPPPLPWGPRVWSLRKILGKTLRKIIKIVASR